MVRFSSQFSWISDHGGMRLAAAMLLVVACVVGVGMGVAAADENDDFVKLLEQAAKTSNLTAGASTRR